jgi:SPP1 gp7 family putative phage head morphogenesis protein
VANIADTMADIAITRSLVLQKVSNGLSNEVALIYKEILDDVDLAIKTADPINLRNANATVKELKSRVDVDLSSQYEDLGELAKTEAGYVMASTNAVIGADIFSKVVKDSTLVNIAKTSLIEGATIKSWFTSLDKSMQTDLERAIKLGASIGENNYELAKRVDGVLNKGMNHARTIARTSVATVSNQARQSVYDANDDVIKGIQHLSTMDSKVSFICATRDSAMWDLNGVGLNSLGKKYRYRVPPLHFQCRSVLVPVLKSWEELGLGDIEEISEGTRSSINGQISSSISFSKWFESKPKTFQEKYLGISRYKMYKDKKITFSDLVNQSGSELSVQMLKEKYG